MIPYIRQIVCSHEKTNATKFTHLGASPPRWPSGYFHVESLVLIGVPGVQLTRRFENAPKCPLTPQGEGTFFSYHWLLFNENRFGWRISSVFVACFFHPTRRQRRSKQYYGIIPLQYLTSRLKDNLSCDSPPFCFANWHVVIPPVGGICLM